jgi:hypothetical protein
MKVRGGFAIRASAILRISLAGACYRILEIKLTDSHHGHRMATEGQTEEDQRRTPSPEEIAQVHASYLRRMRFYRACWLLWIAGSTLIVLSWVEAVPPEIGWAGFGIAGAGTALSFLIHGRYEPKDRFS